MIFDGSVVVSHADGPNEGCFRFYTVMHNAELSWTSWIMLQVSQLYQHTALLNPAKCWLSVTAAPSNPTWSLSSRPFEVKFRL